MAVRSVAASLSRTGIATSALAIAVATVMSIGLMVSSFRSSLIDWLDTTLTADLYVQIGGETEDGAALDDWVSTIQALPDVTGTSLTQRATLPGTDGEVGVRATEPGPDGWGLDLIAGFDPAWEAALGATIRIPTLAGKVDLRIPKGSQSGQALRLKGKGLPGRPPGDQHVSLKVVVPPAASAADETLYRQMAEQMPFNPRKALED